MLPSKKLEPEVSYKYLGIKESGGIQHSHIKEKIREEYHRRIRLVTNSELNAANRIDAMNTFAVPAVTCSVNVIDWIGQELQRIDRKTHKIMTAERMHHPKADKDRMYVNRSEGGRGLIQLETTYKVTTVGLDIYLICNDDPLLKIASTCEKQKKKLRCKTGSTIQERTTSTQN